MIRYTGGFLKHYSFIKFREIVLMKDHDQRVFCFKWFVRIYGFFDYAVFYGDYVDSVFFSKIKFF